MADILLLADRTVGEELLRRFGPGRCVVCSDPYDALAEMRRWPYRLIFLAAPQEDYDALCRAARRLQGGARLLGLCSPPDEPNVQRLVGELLEDYFIYPPVGSELVRLNELLATAAAGQTAPLPAAPTAYQPAGGEKLTVTELANLFKSAVTVAALETALVAAVDRWIGIQTSWCNEADLPSGATVLLRAGGSPPRTLIAARPTHKLPPAGQAMLEDLQQCLPGLLATARRSQSMHRLATTDHLTGVCNRRYFYYLTDKTLRRVARRGLGATLLLYDLDDFKHYNDAYGHAAGDELLRETALMVKRICREHDIVARIGGDEFAVLFWDEAGPRQPDSRPLGTALGLAERFGRAVTAHEFPQLGPEAVGSLTISGGLAQFPRDGQTCRQLLRRADQAMKASKRLGKGRIRLAGREDQPPS